MTRNSESRISHHDRPDLAGEHRLGDAGQGILALLFIIVWLGDTFYFRFSTFLNDTVPDIVRVPIGVVLLGIAWYLAWTTLSIVFGEVREPAHVIREGAYNYCRHPMYLSEIVFYLGLLMFSMSLAAAVVLIMATGFLHFISRHEENLMLARFGDEYREYMREVPMWIPRIRRK